MNERLKNRATGWVVDALLLGLAIIASLAFLLAAPRPSKAAECHTYDEVVALYLHNAETVPSMAVPEELFGPDKSAAIAGAVAFGVTEASGASRVFRVSAEYLGPGVYTYGFEVDGCMLDPIYGVEVGATAPSPSLDSSDVHA